MHKIVGSGLVSTVALALGAAAIAAVATPPPAPARSAQPILVELYTSQGCSSCPPANAAVAALADRPDVLALSFGVTYWDDLGWKDTFASPKYTARQWDYAHGMHRGTVGTPQVVVDGRADTVGQSPREIEPLIRAAQARREISPQIAIQADRVTVASSTAPGKAAQVWLVRYDPRIVQVPVQRGENGGKTLPHRNVVKDLVKLGDWSGPATSFTLRPAADANLKSAVFIQSGTGGVILATAKG